MRVFQTLKSKQKGSWHIVNQEIDQHGSGLSLCKNATWYGDRIIGGLVDGQIIDYSQSLKLCQRCENKARKEGLI